MACQTPRVFLAQILCRTVLDLSRLVARLVAPMNANVQPGHPISSLFVLLRSKLTNELSESFERMLVSISKVRPWVIDPPTLVDYIDETDDAAGEQAEAHTYGAGLKLYSALPPWGAKLPRAIDKMHYEEVKLLVDEACRLSREAGVDFYLQLDRSPIGSIRHGVPDESIQRGLLEEWRRAVESVA